MYMDEQKILATLSSINLWWKGGKVPKRIKKAENKRKIFHNLSKECLDNDEIISISGPRQVGKTTIMGQLIEYQLEVKQVKQKRIIYIPIDNEVLLLNSDNILMDCLKVFFDYIVGETPESLKSKVYVYLDEVQSLDKWAKQIKSYQDSYANIKFLISGSSHTKLYADASESLVGRILFKVLLPFKFMEFLEFNITTRSRRLEFSTVELRAALRQSIKEKKPSALYKQITLLQVGISEELPKIKQLIDDYLIKGGYPGLLKYGKDYDGALEKIKTDLELTVYKDIHKIFNTRNSSELMSLLMLLANSSGQKINYSNLSSILSIDRRIVANYMDYMKLVFLIEESPFYKSNITKKIEKNNKVYLIDAGHRNALVGKMGKEILNEPEIGLVMQTVVFNHARNLKFHLSKYTDYEICYWEDKESEVDVIINLPILLLPTEVKLKSGSKGVKGIKKFIQQHKESKWGMIITKNELKIEENILFMPLWAFLLMC